MTNQIEPPDTWTVVEWPILDASGKPAEHPQVWSVEIQDEAKRTISARTVPLPLTTLEKRLVVREMFADAMSGKDRLS
jgi:hypothetical protein